MLGRKKQIKEHQWVMFSNPRNGQIQISACKNCGTANAPALTSKACEPINGKHAMHDRGWVDEGTEQRATAA